MHLHIYIYIKNIILRVNKDSKYESEKIVQERYRLIERERGINNERRSRSERIDDNKLAHRIKKRRK